MGTIYCFPASEIENGNLRKVALNFSRASESDGSPVFVHGNQIEKIIFDGPSNDIAYVLYEPSATSRLKLDLSPVATPVPPAKDAATAIVGFPVEESVAPQFPKVVSKDCSFTGRSDFIQASENDTSYDGRLFETSCDGWWGMSGGRALGFGNPETPEIIGVTTYLALFA